MKTKDEDGSEGTRLEWLGVRAELDSAMVNQDLLAEE